MTKLVEQSRILDGDDRLSGEVLHQLDLLVGEGANFLAVDGERANQFVLLQHGDSQKCPHATKFDGCNGGWVASVGVALLRCGIGDVNDPLGSQHATRHSFRIGTIERRISSRFREGWRRVVRGDKGQGVAVPAIDIPKRGVADTDRVLQHGGEHALKITR